MANNYDYHHSETMNEDEGACALEAQYGALNNISGVPLTHQQHQQLQEIQQYEPSIVQCTQQEATTAIQSATPVASVAVAHPYTTNIAVKGQKIKSKLNPLAPEFYPSYKRLPKNGYTTMGVPTPHHQQMPNAAAMAAAATASQYGYLDYECNYADWPGYEYDVARYMDYERFMTSHMQRSNTAVTLVRNNYSGSGSAAPPSASSFQDHPSYENLRKNRSFNRSFSGTSYNFRKHKSSKEVSRENMRSWYIDKKAEEKRMESWKNMSAEAYQDTIMPGTSSKDEFFELMSPNSGEQKDANNLEKHLGEYQQHRQQQQQYGQPQQRPNSPSLPPLLIEEAQSQRHSTRAAGGTTESTQRKIKSQRKLKKENTEMSKKKLIMLYPSKRNVSDLMQSSQDSMFSQPNAIQYTSDESFLTQLSSSQQMQSELDKMLNEVKEKNTDSENEIQARRAQNAGSGAVATEAENTDSLDEFELTTKPSEPKIVNTSNSVSPISVIEQTKQQRSKPEKQLKPALEPRTTVKRPKRETERRKHETTLRSTQNKLKEPQVYCDESSELSSLRDKQFVVIKEPETVYAPKRKCFPTPSESSREDSRSSHRNSRSAVSSSDCETPKVVHKIYQSENILAASAKSTGYTGAIPKTRDRESSKNKETSKDISQQPVINSNAILKQAVKSSTTGAIPKIKETQTNQNRKVSMPNNVDPATSKISRAVTQKVNHLSAAHKDEKMQRPPNGIVANRVQIFANSAKQANLVKAEAQYNDKYEPLTHRRLPSRTQSTSAAIAEKRAAAKVTNNEVAMKQQTNAPGSILKKSIAATSVSSAAPPYAAVGNGNGSGSAVEKRPTVKCTVKTQLRSPPTSQHESHSSSKSTSGSHNSPIVSKRESAESKKSKSTVASSSRNVYASSSKPLKTGLAKIPLREKSSSLRGVKAVIGSADGDKNAQVKTSRSCISLRRVSKGLVKKPSLTSTKPSKKAKAAEVQNKKTNDLAPPVTALRSLQSEKRRNLYSDPGADYKIVQTYRHK